MQLPGLVDGIFIKRLNRFAALVDVDGREVMAHVANSGRMGEMLVPGYRVKLRPAPGEHRKTQFDLALVQMEDALVSVDARLPNALVAEALEQGRLPQFRAYEKVRREVTFGESRLDLMLEEPASGPNSSETGWCYIETKSVTLVMDGMALFPDAPTSRGAKHMRSLERAVESGHAAAVIFVIQRSDVDAFTTNDHADPEFGQVFREALLQRRPAHTPTSADVTESAITLSSRLPIHT